MPKRVVKVVVMGRMRWMQQQGGADATEAGTTESTYDACTARKTAKRKNEEFQEKLLNAITAPAPAPEPEQDYIDLAFAAIIKKMKKTLNVNEIMDAVE